MQLAAWHSFAMQHCYSIVETYICAFHPPISVEKTEGVTKADAKDDNVKVAVRCRPLTPKETSDNRGVIVRVDQLRGQVK